MTHVGLGLHVSGGISIDRPGIWLSGGGGVPAPIVNYIDFNGADTVIDYGSGSSIDNLHDGAMTVEAWIVPLTVGEGLAGRILDKGKWLFYIRDINGNGTLVLAGLIDCATTDATAASNQALTPFTPVHVAMTWDNASYTKPRLWINGVEVTYQSTADRSGAVVDDSSDTLYAGNRGAGDRALDAFVGWHRISKVVRYTDTFTLPALDEPPEIDANTVLLVTLDEGAGTSIADSSGNGNNGTLSNGTWIALPNNEHVSTGVGTYKHTASRLPHQRSCFFAQGRYWLFYGYYWTRSNPYPLYYTSSSNGSSWATPTYLDTFPYADAQWAVEYDESTGKVHVATNITTDGSGRHLGLRYRRGTLNSNGTITWDATWQTVLSSANQVGDWSLQVATDGRVWVGYCDDGAADAAKGNAKAIKNANTDGTWSTASGFPVTVRAGVSNDAFVILAPLAYGTMHATCYEWNTDAAASCYIIAADGTVTGDGVATSSSIEADSGTAAKVGRIETASLRDGDVHLVYQDSSRNIKYRKCAVGTWGSEVTLSDNMRVTAAISSPRLSFGDGGKIYVTWSTASKLYLCVYDGATWGTPTEAVSASFEASYEHAMPAFKANGNKLQMVTLLADYTLKHYLLDV